MGSLPLAWVLATLAVLPVWASHFAFAQYQAVRFLNLTACDEDGPLSAPQRALAEELATAQCLGFLTGVFGPGVPALWMALGLPVTATNLPVLAGAALAGLAISLTILHRLRRTTRCLGQRYFTQGRLIKARQHPR